MVGYLICQAITATHLLYMANVCQIVVISFVRYIARIVEYRTFAIYYIVAFCMTFGLCIVETDFFRPISLSA